MSITSATSSSSLNRFTKGKNSLLGDNLKHYPHRESLVKKTSPHKSINNNPRRISGGSIFSSSSLDSTILNKTLNKGTAPVSSELISEISVNHDSPSRASHTHPSQPNPPKISKRGSLLGPFKFMTTEMEEHKLQHYNKGHLETVLKQLDLLQCLITTKLQEDREESEGQILKAWYLVNEKEEEAFTVGIKERTTAEVHNVHHRLLDMEKTMEKVCESLAPTFEKFASFNELKVAEKETENYVKSIKKFNVRTKINQEYSDRILKLEKSIDFLERTNEKSQRMVRTPIIEQVKRIDSRIMDNTGSLLPSRDPSPSVSITSTNSVFKAINRSGSKLGGGLSMSRSFDADDFEKEKSKGIAVELEVPKTEEATVKTEEKLKSPLGRPPVPFAEKSPRASFIKENKSDDNNTINGETNKEKVFFQEKATKPSWMKEKSIDTNMPSTPPIAALESPSRKTDNLISTTETPTFDKRKSSTKISDLLEKDNQKTEKVVVEKKVFARASWIKDKKELEETDATMVAPIASAKLPSSFPQIAKAEPLPVETTERASNKSNQSFYVPKPDSKLPPPSDMLPSSVVKSIVSQINTSKTLNSSFYEKKLQQSGSPESKRIGASYLTTINEVPDLDLPPPVELRPDSKKSWRELASAHQIPVPPLPAPIKAPTPPITATVKAPTPTEPVELRKHRRTPSGGKNNAIDITPSSVPDFATSTQLQPESSKNTKSWKALSLSRSNETAQNSTYEPAVAGASIAKKEEGIIVRETISNGLNLDGPFSSHNSSARSSASSAMEIFNFPKEEGPNSSANLTTNTTSSRPSTPKFQPKLSVVFNDNKTVTATSPSPNSLPITTIPPATIGSIPPTPPRITGSRGLISAISLNRQKAEAAAAANEIPPAAAPYGSTWINNNRSPSANSDNSNNIIPTRSSLDVRPEPSPKFNKSGRQTPPVSRREFEQAIDEIVMNAPLTNNEQPSSSNPGSPRLISVPSGASADELLETGSAISGVTMDSKLSGSKKKRLTIKGVVKRVNSLFRTATAQRLNEEDIISEQNLNKQQLAFVEENRTNFIEKKIDEDTTIVTNTPVIKPPQPQSNNEIDFSFIEHIDHIKDDDISSVDQSEDHHHHQQPQQQQQQQLQNEMFSAVPGKGPIGALMMAEGSGSSITDSKEGKGSKSLSKRISGLVRKTSSMFQKITGAPEAPPRPDNLPPFNNEKKANGGIAIAQSDSFDVPNLRGEKIESLDYYRGARPVSILVNNKPTAADIGIPVDTNSLGTVDKIIQQQQAEQPNTSTTATTALKGGDEEGSVDKFDANGVPKPKKFKPVKFLKKTFSKIL